MSDNSIYTANSKIRYFTLDYASSLKKLIYNKNTHIELYTDSPIPELICASLIFHKYNDENRFEQSKSLDFFLTDACLDKAHFSFTAIVFVFVV